MNRRVIIRTAMVVAFVGLSFGGWLATRGQVIDAIGGTWAPQDVAWHRTTDGAQRAALIWEPKRVQLVRASGQDLLASLCAATLAHMDQLGAPDPSADTVYRVDMNILLDDGTPIFPAQMPVPVRGGECVMDLFGGTEFFRTYAAPLDGWYLAGGGVKVVDEGDPVPTMIFRPLPSNTQRITEFDLTAACAAVMGDPGAWNLLMIGAAPQADRLSIRVMSGSGQGNFSTGIFFADTFDVTDGSCSPVAAGGE